MFEALWLAAYLAANLWGGDGITTVNVADRGDGVTLVVNGMKVAAEGRTPAPRELIGTSILLDYRTESGPPILSNIPYVSRLFRNVGWSRSSVPIMAPLNGDERPCCEEPTRAEILDALPDSCVPGVCEAWRGEVHITTEKLVDRVDPARFFPLIGPAQLHRVHWKCIASYTETLEFSFPGEFRASRKCEEVIYIDKDHLHLCAAQKDDSEAQEARPLPMRAARPMKCDSVPQVQLDIIVAKIDRSARPDLRYPWASDKKSDVIDSKVAMKFLNKVRDEGDLKIIAEPHVITLSGQEANFITGGEIAVKTTAGISYAPIGTQVKLAPSVTTGGKVRLRVVAEISGVDSPDDNPAGTRVIRNAYQESSAELKAGEALVIGGIVSQEERKVDYRIPLLSELPVVGQFFKLTKLGINEETVILVTPHIDTPCRCQAEPDTRVVACWENRPGTMVGSVYLFSEETQRPISAAGRIEVQAFDMAPALKGEEPRLLAKWTFDRGGLEKLQRKDLIGDGYTLSVDWADLPAKVENIKLKTVYVPAEGASCADAPTYVARRSADDNAAPAVATQERPSKTVHAQPVSNQRPKEALPATRPAALSVAEIVTLSKAGVAKGIILRQMEIAKGLTFVHAMTKADEYSTVLSQLKLAGFTLLTVDDVIEMTKQGVDEEVIRTLQEPVITYLKQYYGN